MISQKMTLSRRVLVVVRVAVPWRCSVLVVLRMWTVTLEFPSSLPSPGNWQEYDPASSNPASSRVRSLT